MVAFGFSAFFFIVGLVVSVWILVIGLHILSAVLEWISENVGLFLGLTALFWFFVAMAVS